MLSTRLGLTGILLVVFAVNYVETMAETQMQLWRDLGYEMAYAFHHLEGDLTFLGHDGTSSLAVYGYSISYFFLYPMLALGVAIILGRRPAISPYRIFVLATAFDYLISLPFFIFFPIPERWAFPASGAMLLSDRWTAELIQALRPFSGLDNCFPSFHVSLTVVIIGVTYLGGCPYRNLVLGLGTTIILSTFVLGIHWVPDMIAGLAVGILSTFLGVALDERLTRGAAVGARPAHTVTFRSGGGYRSEPGKFA